jgi:hypothetical protein
MRQARTPAERLPLSVSLLRYFPRSGRDAVGNGVVVEGSVVAQLEPATLSFGRLRHAVALIRSEVLPRVVADDGQEIPGSTF